MKGSTDFNIQQATNATAYSDYNFEILNLNVSTTVFLHNITTDHTSGLSDGSSTSVRHIRHAENSNIVKGLSINGSGVPSESLIVAINNSTHFTINQDTNATVSDNAISFTGGEVSDTSTYITAHNPAKKVVLYSTAADDTNDPGDFDILTVTLNANTATEKKIAFSVSDLPFVFDGLLITSLSLKIDHGNFSEQISCLSFH